MNEWILIMIRQPRDDLHHLDQCYRRYIEAGVLDKEHNNIYVMYN